MKFLLFALAITFIISCEYGYVKKIDDQVKNEVTYIWNSMKEKYSSIHSQNRTFHTTFIKKKSKPEIITVEINSTFPVTYKDYQDTVYVIMQNNVHRFPLQWKNNNIDFKEKKDIIDNYTTTNTDVKTENTTTINPITIDAENKTNDLKSTTNTTTTTTTKTDRSTTVHTDILNKIHSERFIELPIDKLPKSYLGFKIRIYTVNDDDFWELNYSSYDYINIMNVANSKATYPSR